MVSFYSVILYSFLLAIIFFRLPNFYFLPFVTSGFFTTQAIARIILVILFLASFFYPHQEKILYFKNNRSITVLLLFFFLSASVSIFWAQNIDAFLGIYKDFVIGICSFFVFQMFKKERMKIVIAFIIPIPFNTIYQVALLYGNTLFDIVKNSIYEKHFDLVYYNLQRNRVYTDVYDEAFLSLLILLLNKKNKTRSVFLFVGMIAISCLAFLSNFRTRVVMLVLGILASFIVLQKITIKKIIYLCMSLGIIAILISFVSYSAFGFKFYDRFLLLEQIDIQTVFSRVIQIENGLEMGLISPFGVGMGNYYDNLMRDKSIYDTFSPLRMQSSANQYIHNNVITVIAESGYIAFVFYLVLLFKFAAMDRKILKTQDSYKKAIVMAFWLLFFFGLLNPPIPGSYQVVFWGLRGLLM